MRSHVCVQRFNMIVCICLVRVVFVVAKNVIGRRFKQLTLHSATRFQLVTWNHGRHEGNEEGYEEGSSTCSTSHEEKGDEGHEEVRSCLSIAGRPIEQRPALTH